MAQSVYFTSLGIENVRCFGDTQELDLTVDRRRPAQWTLILGDNGVGKTTLLQCLAWMRLIPGKYDPALFDEDNAFLERLLPNNRRGNLGLVAKMSIGSSLSSINPMKQAASRGRSVITGLSILVDSEGNLSSKSAKKPRLFEESLVIAYGANRQLGFQNLKKKELLDPIGSRLADNTELYDLEEMLGNLHYGAETKAAPERDRLDLKRLKEVLAKILPEDTDPDAIQIFAPDSLGRGGLSGVYLETFTGSVSLSELSFGYRTTLAWTADLAWRLLREYPDSKNPFAEPAVVLIDELDLHLHPRWQLGIMKDLSVIFPGTQFVATSHSPLLAQVAEDANFVLLNKRGDDRTVEIINEPTVVRGWRVDQILTSDLFGALGGRSPHIELLFTRRDELLTKLSRSADEEAELGHLRAQIAELPTAQFPDDQKAMDSIREAAALLKKHSVGLE